MHRYVNLERPRLLLVGLLFALMLWATQTGYCKSRQGSPAVVNSAVSSPLRETISLDGTWDFAVDPGKKGRENKWFSSDKPLPDRIKIEVPGAWEAQGIGGPGNSSTVTPEKSIRPLRGSYTGTAWYRKKVNIPGHWEGKQIWLEVGGVHCQGWFWVNGEFVAHVANYCGTYKYNITDLVSAGDEALIAAEVRNDVPSGKGLFSWIHRFGGLYRSVEIEATARSWIDYAYVEPLFDEQKARVHVELKSCERNPWNEKVLDIVVRTVEGIEAGRAVRSLNNSNDGNVDLVVDIALDPFRAWSPENPNLYCAHILLRTSGGKADGWMERFGVRKWEARGRYFFLNNKEYFVRGYGDDFIYPLTLCSPADRKVHKKHLKLAKSYGFCYVRHHTHCELPEFFEAADEVGIMVQPELPYYGRRPSANTGGYFRPKEDLKELITHYRRYVSLSTYCTGNEGYLGSPLDKEIYQLAKKMDPTRLFLHQDGGESKRSIGRNTPENSDFFTIWGPDMKGEERYHEVERNSEEHQSRAHFIHEFLNLATDEDPRLAEKYTGAIRPPVTPRDFRKNLQQMGLKWDWRIACIDAGKHLQSIWQKRGLECARLAPACDGYIYWTIVDVGSPSAQGLFNQFWEPKVSTAEYFKRFNSQAILLAKMPDDSRILAGGDEMQVQWWISNFGGKPVRDRKLCWQLLAGSKTLDSGTIEGVSAEGADVKEVARTRFVVPEVDVATRAELRVELEGTAIENRWDVWLFPDVEEIDFPAKTIAATERVYENLAGRYPGLIKLDSQEAKNADIVIADALDEQVEAAFNEGRKVILLGIGQANPGVKLGWWVKTAQTGTAVAEHPAFGRFPHRGFLDELFFRIAGSAVIMSRCGFENVEPLMVGHGKLGYLLYVFQAQAGEGRLLGCGLNLLSDNPEAVYLLNEFIKYAGSDCFEPKGKLDIDKVRDRLIKSN